MTDPDDGDAPDSTLVDPGDEPEAPAQRRTPVAEVLAAIAVGGVLGAEARYGLGVAIPHAAGQWPWATFLTNASGCLLIGVLMVVILELSTPHPLVRPLLGVGVLGGYTTFSTCSVDTLDLLQPGRTALALPTSSAHPWSRSPPSPPGWRWPGPWAALCTDGGPDRDDSLGRVRSQRRRAAALSDRPCGAGPPHVYRWARSPRPSTARCCSPRVSRPPGLPGLIRLPVASTRRSCRQITSEWAPVDRGATLDW